MTASSGPYAVGQRYISESEPELGLGLVTLIDNKLIDLFFPDSQSSRRYGMSTAPLRRIKFDKGTEITLANGEKLAIDSVVETAGVLQYISGERSIPEAEIVSSSNMNRPEERFLIGKFDTNSFYNLRFEVLQNKRCITHSPVRGFLGGRVARIPHQLYIADQAMQIPHPRILLADEVGLGKTIEAGLIIHKLLITERAERVLIVVPDSLAYQWFVEMFRKFRLSFTVLNQETYLEKDTQPFKDTNLIITGLGFLKGAELARRMVLEANWDVLVVDEAHQLKWSSAAPSLEYNIIEQLAKNTPSVLLLTATPEQLGGEGHFARLRLLDPQRFHNLDQYHEESRQFAKVGEALKHAQLVLSGSKDLFLSPADKDYLNQLHGSPIEYSDQERVHSAIKQIIDRHGTGRIYFRNSRVKMAHEFNFFPKRFVHAYPLEFLKITPTGEEIEDYADDQHLGPAFKARLLWLIEFLQQNKSEKILLICHSKERVLALDKKLRDSTTGLNWGMFHSDLSLLARDRQAAYFAEPDGARILLCTEIGSEGRNFAFCQHLILFDLPKNPDLLEQRIGRLDRIGQKKDIHIHVPYIAATWEEIFFRWYDEGLAAFSHYARAGRQVFERMKEELMVGFDHPKRYTSESSPEMRGLINKTLEVKHEVESVLDMGRDYLVEQNSFDHHAAAKLVSLVQGEEGGDELKDFMEKVFDHLGVDIEDLNQNSFYIKPGDNMFIPYFPCLPPDGVTVTYSRERALEREDYEFLTWDHPMVTGIIEVLLGNNFGSVALASRAKQGHMAKGYFEGVFVLDAIAPKNIEVERFLPPTPIRILINMEGENLSQKWPKEVIDQKISESDSEQKKTAPKIGKEKLYHWTSKAHAHALVVSMTARQESKEKAAREINSELERLQSLGKDDPNIIGGKREWMQKQLVELQKSIDEATLRLDSFRVIL
ncbi:MAG: RNA polymerase-associated protein RapA [Bdellovibrio sp.]|nr:RNA polymerase-associated protein RapA [Bdellovibrio sp.]